MLRFIFKHPQHCLGAILFILNPLGIKKIIVKTSCQHCNNVGNTILIVIIEFFFVHGTVTLSENFKLFKPVLIYDCVICSDYSLKYVANTFEVDPTI